MIKAAGILLLDAEGRALFLLRGDGGDAPYQWCVPGGRLEEGEDTLTAAVRECEEESGFKVDPKALELHTRRIGTVATPELMPALMPSLPVEAALSLSRSDKAEFIESEHPRDKEGKFSTASSAGEGGKRVHAETGAELPEHIRSLKIPPAWTNVRYSEEPGSALLVTGRDAKDRPQAIYSLAHQERQAAAKFARVQEMHSKFASMRKQNADAMRDPKLRDTAECLALIMETGIRPGGEGDTGAEKQAYGATTLMGSHVIRDGADVRLEFIGKKGVSLSIPVNDPKLARMLVERSDVAGPGGKLFPGTDAKRLLDHVHTLDGGGFKTKDFRTNVGTTTAYDLVRSVAPPKDEKSYRKAVMAIAKQVSRKLGNTPTIALQSYINPAVFADWRSSALGALEARKDSMAAQDDDNEDDELPSVRFGKNISLPNWRDERDAFDPDDAQIETPHDVVEMLGFDPVEEENRKRADGFVRIDSTDLPSAINVDFTTFLLKDVAPFTPKLGPADKPEHVGYAWAPCDHPPEPLHEGCRIALARLTMDEVDVARAMAVGELTSPQHYGNIDLYAIRISGTGVAYRNEKKDDKGNVIQAAEFVYRRPEDYLTDKFLARCNGLFVIMFHPKSAILDAAEFQKRIMGSVLLPFIKEDEVWGIAKVIRGAGAMVDAETLSTSPGVLLGEDNLMLRTQSGENMLIEGKPFIVDHIAILPSDGSVAGVWDKGGPPVGVSRSDSFDDALSRLSIARLMARTMHLPLARARQVGGN